MQKRIARFCIRDEFFAVPPEFRPSLAGRALMDLIPLVFQKGEGPGSANAAAAAGPTVCAPAARLSDTAARG